MGFTQLAMKMPAACWVSLRRSWVQSENRKAKTYPQTKRRGANDAPDAG